jgi:SAM-dependent methyltransferase
MGNALETVVGPVKSDWVSHIYYDQAEQPDFLTEFWGDDTRFARAFTHLDRTMMVELACGHGRHAAQIVDTVGLLFLLDVNEPNIQFCCERFDGRANVRCEVNSGFDLEPVETGSAASVYSYDAMVHFEPDIVGAYLLDAARVLRPGGRALLHHSAYSGNPGAHYSANPHYRNYMTPDLFKHFAIRAGLTVVSQEVFGWGSGDTFAPDIDALTLLQR